MLNSALNEPGPQWQGFEPLRLCNSDVFHIDRYRDHFGKHLLISSLEFEKINASFKFV